MKFCGLHAQSIVNRHGERHGNLRLLLVFDYAPPHSQHHRRRRRHHRRHHMFSFLTHIGLDVCVDLAT